MFIGFRYKKPHAEEAMEKTKPINPNIQQRKVTALVNIHTHAGFSSAGQQGHSNSMESKVNNLYKSKASIKHRKEIRNSLHQTLAKENTWNTGGGGLRWIGRRAGKRGWWWVGTLLEGNP